MPTIPPAASPSERRAETERHEHGLAEVLGKRHLGAGGDVLGEDEVPRVRVDPPLAGLPQRRRRVPRETGRVRQQVPDGRAFGPRRLVQVERALLGGDQRRVGDDRLRDGAPAEAVIDVAVLGDDRVGSRDTGGSMLGRPRLDLAERFHGRRY